MMYGAAEGERVQPGTVLVSIWVVTVAWLARARPTAGLGEVKVLVVPAGTVAENRGEAGRAGHVDPAGRLGGNHHFEHRGAHGHGGRGRARRRRRDQSGGHRGVGSAAVRPVGGAGAAEPVETRWMSVNQAGRQWWTAMPATPRTSSRTAVQTATRRARGAGSGSRRPRQVTGRASVESNRRPGGREGAAARAATWGTWAVWVRPASARRRRVPAQVTGDGRHGSGAGLLLRRRQTGGPVRRRPRRSTSSGAGALVTLSHCAPLPASWPRHRVRGLGAAADGDESGLLVGEAGQSPASRASRSKRRTPVRSWTVSRLRPRRSRA